MPVKGGETRHLGLLGTAATYGRQLRFYPMGATSDKCPDQKDPRGGVLAEADPGAVTTPFISVCSRLHPTKARHCFVKHPKAPLQAVDRDPLVVPVVHLGEADLVGWVESDWREAVACGPETCVGLGVREPGDQVR